MESGWKLLNGTGDESVEITFTVSGFDYDNPDAVAATEAPAADNAAGSGDASDSDSSGSGVPVAPIAAAVIILIVIGGIVTVRKKTR